MPNFSGSVGQVFDLFAFDISHLFDKVDSADWLYCANENCFGFSFEAGNDVEADIGGHVDGVDVEVSSVEPKVLCFFCLFIYLIQMLLLNA